MGELDQHGCLSSLQRESSGSAGGIDREVKGWARGHCGQSESHQSSEVMKIISSRVTSTSLSKSVWWL